MKFELSPMLLILEADLIVASSDKLSSRAAIKQEFKNVKNYSRFKKKTTFSGQNIIIQEQRDSPSQQFLFDEMISLGCIDFRITPCKQLGLISSIVELKPRFT